MIAGTKRGILVDTNRGFSIDDQRMSFRFTTELGWEIRDGKLGRLLKNCSYQSVTPQFWAGLDALGGPDEWKVHGVPSCNKGEPLQVAHVGHGTVPGRFQNVQAMSIERTDIEQALQILGPGTRLDVLGENAELLRYAESEITAQHSERRLRVRVKVNRDGRTAGGTLETLDPAAVQVLADRLTAALADLPAPASEPEPTDEPVGTTPDLEQAVVEPAKSIVDCDPAVRHEWFTTVRDGLDGSARLGGAIRYDVLDRVVANSAGLFRSETLTKASIQAIAKQDGQSVSVKLVHRDADLIPVADIPGRLREALRPLPVREPFRGSCRVLLKPSAVNTLIATFGHWALGAQHYASGRSVLAGRMGERVVSEQLTVDDATDTAGLLSGFDAEGNVRRRTR